MNETRTRKTKRRAKGEGTIYKRSDGLWVGRLTIGKSATGKRIRRAVYGKTQGETRQKMDDLKDRKRMRTAVEVNKQTVAEYLTHWLANVVKPSRRPNTYDCYRKIVENHLVKSDVAGVQLALLNRDNIEAMLGTLLENGIGSRTRQLCYVVLRKALQHATAKARLLPFNPAADIERPTHVKAEINPYTMEEAAAILDAARGHRLEALIVLAMMGGLRQGELFGLWPGDVDFEAGAIYVQRTLVEIDGKFSYGEPKSKAGKRRVEIDQRTMDALRGHLALRLKEGHRTAEALFCNVDGGYLGKSNFRRRVWLPLLKRAGVPVHRFHDVRHTHASGLCRMGEHPKVVQGRLGHGSIAITMDIYSHLMKGQDREAADRFGAMITGKREQPQAETA